MNQFNIEQIKGAYDCSPFAFSVIKVTLDENSGEPQNIIFEYVNDALSQLEGCKKEEMLGKSFYTVFENADKKWLKLYGRVAWGGSPATMVEYSPEICKHLKVQCYQIAEGYCGCLISDMTAELMTEKALNEEQEKYQQLLSAVPGGIAVYRSYSEEHAELEYFNDELCTITGYTREEIVQGGSKNVCRAVPEDFPVVNEVLRNASAHGRTANTIYRTITKTGEMKYIQLCASLVEESGHIQTVYVVYTDVTEQQKQQRAVQAQNKEISQIYNAIPGGVFRCKNEPGWPVVFANASFYNFIGYTREEFRRFFDNKMLGVIYPDDVDEITNVVERQLRCGNKIKNNNRLVCKDGTIKWIDIHAERNIDSEGEQSLYCVFVDITEQKRSAIAARELAVTFSLVADKTDLNIWQYDIPSDTLFQTTNSKRAHGIEKDVIENFTKDVIDEGHVRSDSIPAFLRLHERLKQGANTAEETIWYKTPDNSSWWCEHVSYYTIFDENNMPVRAVGIGRNVTKEIQESAERKKLDIALKSSNLFLWEYDILGKRYIQQSNAINGFQAKKAISDAPEVLIRSGFVHKDSVEDFIALHEAVARGDKSATRDICVVNPSGELIWKSCTYTTIFADGKPVSAIGCAVDINASKAMERKFREEARYLEAVQSESLLVKVRANLTKNIVESYTGKKNVELNCKNASYDEVAEALAQTGLTAAQSKEIRRMLKRDRVIRAMESGEPHRSYNYQRITNDGSVIWVNLSSKTYCDPDTGDVMSFMYTHDIDKERTMQTIVDRITDIGYEFLGLIFLETRKLHYVRASSLEAGCLTDVDEMYDQRIEEFTNLYAEQSIRCEARERISIERICKELENNLVYTCALPLNIKGKIYRKKWEFAYLDENKSSIMMTRSDVTELFLQQEQQRENLRNALAQAEQANRAKSEFLSRMSHEIRTPMNAIIGMSTLAAQCINDPKEVSDCIAKVGLSARFLLSLINDILDMSRIESGKVTVKNEKFPFEEFVNGINTMIYEQAHAKGIDYDCVVTSFTEPFYYGDAMKLQQVLVNLLGNAVKFTPAGGKVQFIIHQDKVQNGYATLRFTVNDTGVGIKEEFLPHLFEPFEQGDAGVTSVYGGTGLGLAISKNLVDMMHGHIGVTSIENVGTEFTVTLDLGLCQEQSTPGANVQTVLLNKLSALVVDDDVAICENTKRILVDMGIKAEWADSGRKAIELIKNELSRNVYFDVVLLDWKMPELDGIATAREIRKLVGPDVTIIIMTAYDWSMIEQEAMAAGVNMLISKPLFKSSLSSAFTKIYSQREQEKIASKDREFDFTGRRILLVEDHLLNVEVARRLLAAKGCQVQVAPNGLMAIEAFTTTPVGYFDAILMDIRMPVMDGLTAARSIRHLSKATAKTIPIIAMSANAFDEDVEKSKSAGMSAHLAKPIEPQLLYSTLEKLMDRDDMQD